MLSTATFPHTTAEGPNFVTLEPFAGQVPQVLVLVLGADLPDVPQELEDRSLGRVGNPARRPDGVSLRGYVLDTR